MLSDMKVDGSPIIEKEGLVSQARGESEYGSVETTVDFGTEDPPVDRPHLQAHYRAGTERPRIIARPSVPASRRGGSSKKLEPRE